jgi:hypothetical protein
MQLTPEQERQIQQAKSGGERRAIVSFTPKQRKEWRTMVDVELAGKDENIAHHRKIKAAAEQAGFFGDIRRAILLSRPSIDELAATIGVEPRVLSDFRAAEADLSPAVLDRLIGALGLRLMQEIPR